MKLRLVFLAGCAMALAACGRSFTAPKAVQASYELAVLSGDQQSGTVGAALSAPFVVKVTQGGQPVSGVQVLFSVAAGGGSLARAAVTTEADGTASTTLTLGPSPVTNTVTATAGGKTVTFSASASVDASSVASVAVVSGDGATVSAALSTDLVVAALDAHQNPLPGASIQWTIQAGSGQLSSPSSTTDANGHATITFTASNSSGPVQVRASSGAIPGVVLTITVVPAEFDSLRITSGATQTVQVDGYLQDIVVAAQDAYGNGIAGVDIVPDDPLNEFLPLAPKTTGPDGTATFSGIEAGPVADSTAPLHFALTDGTSAQAATIDIEPGSPELMLPFMDGGYDDGGAPVVSGTVSTQASTDLAVRLTDLHGNPVPNQLVSFATPDGAVAPLVTTDADGVAASSWLLGPIAGAQRARAQFGTQLAVDFAAFATPGAVAQLQKVTGDLTQQEVCTPVHLGAIALDAHGNPVPGVPVTFQFASANQLARCAGYTADAGSVVALTLDDAGAASADLLLGPVAGGQGPQASATGATPVTYTVTALPGPAALIVPLGADVAQGSAGQLLTGIDARVEVFDAYANPALNHPLELSVVQGGGSVSDALPFPDGRGQVDVGWTLGTQAGSNALEVRSHESDAGVVTLRAVGSPGSPAGIVAISPSAITVPLGGTARAVVQVVDQFGNGVADGGATVTWAASGGPQGFSAFDATRSVGPLGFEAASNGQLTQLSGQFTVTASANGALGPVAGSAQFTVTVQPQLQLTLTPPGAFVGDGTLTVKAHTDRAGGPLTPELDGQSRTLVQAQGGDLYFSLAPNDTAAAGVHTVSLVQGDGGLFASASFAVIAARAPYGPAPLVYQNGCPPDPAVGLVPTDGGPVVVSGTSFFQDAFDPTRDEAVLCGSGGLTAGNELLEGYAYAAGPQVFDVTFGGNGGSGVSPQIVNSSAKFPLSSSVSPVDAVARIQTSSGLELVVDGPLIGSAQLSTFCADAGAAPPSSAFVISPASNVATDPDAGPPAVFCGEGPPPVSVAVEGDFNGDNAQDAVFFGSGNYRLVRGHTAPQAALDVAPPVALSGGATMALAAIAGHFAGTGALDLAYVDEQGTLHLLQGNGDGTFTEVSTQTILTPAPYARFHGPALALGHFGPGAYDDLFVAIPAINTTELGELRSYRATGAGFAQLDSIPTDHYTQTDTDPSAAVSFPRQMASYDVTGDGVLDAILGTRFAAYHGNGIYGGYATPQVSAVATTDGGGLWGTVEVVNGGFGASAPTFVDLDGDGQLDAIAGMNDRITAHLNLGRGRFSVEKNTFISGGTPSVFAVGDFDGDRVPDVVFSAAASLVAVLPGDGTGQFGSGIASTGALLSGESCSATHLSALDLDGDGKLDVLGTFDCTAGGPNAVTRVAASLLGDGSGHLAVAHWEVLGFGVQKIADLDDDGVPDLLADASYPVLLASFGSRDASGGVTFSAPQAISNLPNYDGTAGEYAPLTVLDVNGDQRTDIVQGNVAWLRGAGRSYTARALPAAGRPVGDLNHDGVTDLVVSSDNGSGITPVKLLFLDPTWSSGATQSLSFAGELSTGNPVTDVAAVPLGNGPLLDLAITASPYGDHYPMAPSDNGRPMSFFTVLDAP